MSKARLLQDYLIPGNAENENTLIADNWLEFVSASDDREPPPAVRFTESDLRERVREFQKQMSAVVRTNESLRQALSEERYDHPVMASGITGMPWAVQPGYPKPSTSGPPDVESADDDGEYGADGDGPPLSPSPIGTLLLKILGK